MTRYIRILIGALMFMLCASSCTVSVPERSSSVNKMPNIYPDYTDIIVPINIAPLNFHIEEKGEEYLLKATLPSGRESVFKANSNGDVVFGLKEWREMLKDAEGGEIVYELYARQGSRWNRYNSFHQTVSSDSIDRYITYRLIEPLYTAIGNMGIYQYDLETAEQTTILDYRMKTLNRDMKHTYCMNCHTTQKSNPNNRLFYIRGTRSGMVLTYNGEVRLVNPKCGDMPFSTGYSAWHPTLPLIAGISEKVRQSFTTNDPTKIYQFDLFGDLVLYDVEKNEVTNIVRTKDKLEGLMCWSPDGQYLYFSSSDSAHASPTNLNKLRYDIKRVKFDANTKSFSEPEMVICASEKDSSVASPKITPDGRFLMYRKAKYGMYMQTNKTADIYVMNLETKQHYPLDSINSPQPENFHDFSSTGRWILFESKKEDANYGKVYFSYFDSNGVAHKPFALPHEYPQYDRELLKCYNTTEFTTVPNKLTADEYHAILERDTMSHPTFASKIDSSYLDGASGASVVRIQK